MRRAALLVALAAAAALLLSCGPGGAGDMTRTALGIQPASALVGPGALVQFAAESAAPAVTWTVTETGGGSVTSAGLYTAPTCSTGTYHVVATAGGLSGSASVTVAGALVEAVTSVAVSPGTASVVPGGTQQFTATVKTSCGNTYSVQAVAAVRK